MSSPEETWAGILDALERDCDAGAAFVPPAAPGPIPAALLPRAGRLARRMTELIDDLERQRAEVSRELEALAAAGTRERPHPHFFDASA